MLSYQTVEPHTLELLRKLMDAPQLRQAELVALRSMTYFDDAESFAMPKMFVDFDWEELKHSIVAAVNEYVS